MQATQYGRIALVFLTLSVCSLVYKNTVKRIPLNLEYYSSAFNSAIFNMVNTLHASNVD